MNTDDLINLLGWKWDAFHLAIAAGVLGRLWHAAGGWRGFMKLGGLVGIAKSLLFGTNTPTSPNEAPKPAPKAAVMGLPSVGDPPPDPPDSGT